MDSALAEVPPKIPPKRHRKLSGSSLPATDSPLSTSGGAFTSSSNDGESSQEGFVDHFYNTPAEVATEQSFSVLLFYIS